MTHLLQLMQVVYDKCWRRTHGLVRGKPQKGNITLSQDGQLSGMAVKSQFEVKQLTLFTNNQTYGPWGDLTEQSPASILGAIVGFFGCNANGYVAGIGVWIRNKDTVPVAPSR